MPDLNEYKKYLKKKDIRVANDIFDMSNVKIFKEIEKKKWRMFILCYEWGSICNEDPFITPSTNALGFYAVCQTKDQSVAVML